MTLEAILHLNAITFALCVAYLGLDSTNVEPKNIDKDIAAAKSKAKLVVTRCDCQNDMVKPDGMHTRFSLPNTFRFFIACYIAEIKVSKGKWLALHLCHRLSYFMPVRYFKWRLDKKVTLPMGIMSFSGFIYLTWAALWHAHWFIADADSVRISTMIAFERLLFFVYTIMSVFVMINATLAHRINNIENVTERVCATIEGEMTKVWEDQVRFRNGPPPPTAP